MKQLELIKTLNENYLKDIGEENKIVVDTIRKKPRIEIPAAFAISLLREGKQKEAIKLLDLILDKQKEQGYWLEFSYEKEEEPVGYYGAIPTCFCIFALCEGYIATENKKYLYAAIKACDYLYSQENSGYFFKAQQNKSDVINTNLMCALALIKTTQAMSRKSRRISSYEGAAARAIRRSLNSQKLNGAFPYTSYGLTVPFLYHSMTLALLINLSKHFKDGLLNTSIKKGVKYLRKISKDDASINWSKEKYSDKTGSSWVYGWNYNIYFGLNKEDDLEKTKRKLNSLMGNKYFKEGDFATKEDPDDLFYTSWTILAISLSKHSHMPLEWGNFLRFYTNKLYKVPKILSLGFKILSRKFFSYGLDKGPVEYW